MCGSRLGALIRRHRPLGAAEAQRRQLPAQRQLLGRRQLPDAVTRQGGAVRPAAGTSPRHLRRPTRTS